MSLRVLYIDAVYPPEWLAKKQAGMNISGYDFISYREWILQQRIYLSDYISGNLRANGFECEELIVNDPVFIKKLPNHIKSSSEKRRSKQSIKSRIKKLASLSPMKVYQAVKPTHYAKTESAIRKTCEFYQPDIIFVREPSGIDTYSWKRFRQHALIVGLIGCNTSHPYNWLSHNFDVLFSLTEEYQRFFKVQGIPSYLFSYGVEEKVYNELQKISGKIYDVVFVGLLGNEVQTVKTKLLEHIAARFNFKWWGPRNVDEIKFPFLYRSYQGQISGIEMLEMYRQSKIVVNDYVDTANATAVNLRLYEVLNTGSFLLTRYAANLEQIFPRGMLAMYESEEDCIDKIHYFLKHEAEREAKAAEASNWALKNMSYSEKIKRLGKILSAEYQSKFKIETD